MTRILALGVRNVRKHLVVWTGLYLSKLALAALFSIPLLVMVNNALESSRYAKALLTDWSLDVIIELSLAEENLMLTFIVVLVFYSVVVFLLKQFLNGGIYSSLLACSRPNRRRFFGDCGVLFADNVRIALLMILVYFGLLLLALAVSSTIPATPFREFGSVSLYLHFLRFALLYPFLIMGTILSDLLRFRLCAFPAEPFGRRLQVAMGVFRAKFVQLNGIYYVFFLPFVGVWLGVEWLAMQMTQGLGSMPGVVFELVLFQLCSFLRTGQSLLGTASYACLLAEPQVETMWPAHEVKETP